MYSECSRIERYIVRIRERFPAWNNMQCGGVGGGCPYCAVNEIIDQIWLGDATGSIISHTEDVILSP